jgi:hypothetical protein
VPDLGASEPGRDHVGAGEAAAIVAEHETRVAEIRAEYEKCLKRWERYEANAERIGRDSVPRGPKGCARERDRALRKEQVRFRREVEDFEVKQRLLRPEVERAAEVVNEEDVAGPDRDDLLGGEPYLRADYEAAGKLYRRGLMTIRAIEKARGLSHKRAFRLYRQFKAGAVVYDDAGLHTGSGYRFNPDLLMLSPAQYKLIRR